MADAVDDVVTARETRDVVAFGDEEMSDVVLTVGDYEFHAHRAFLATRSVHFKELFAAHPPSENEKIWISVNEDGDDFKLMLNMLYNNFYGKKDIPFVCPFSSLPDHIAFDFTDEHARKALRSRWRWFYDDAMLAKKYKVTDVVRPILERHLLKLALACKRDDCALCAARNLVAIFFDWRNAIEYMKTSVTSLVSVLKFLSSDSHIRLRCFHIHPSALSMILDNIIKEEKLRFKLPEKVDTAICCKAEVLKFGRSNVPTDLILDVEGTEFHVHKQFLALNSPVFAAMFFSRFIEDMDRIEMTTDGVAFKDLLDLLYNGQLEDEVDFLGCDRDHFQMIILKFWQRLPGIMQLFDFYDFPRRVIEGALKSCGREDCIECANKRLFAMHYRLQSVKERIHVHPRIMAACLRNLDDVLPNPLRLTPHEICDIIESTKRRCSSE